MALDFSESKKSVKLREITSGMPISCAIRTVITSQNLGINPLVGVLIELPIILLFAWRVCDSVMRWMRVSPDLSVRLLTCATALIAILAAEYSLSAFVLGRSLPDFLATYGQPEALVGLAGQFIFALFPLFRWMEREPKG